MDLWNKGHEFTPVISPSSFPYLSTIFLSVGFIFASMFLIYELMTSKKERSLLAEIGTALPASVLLGFGGMMLMQSSGLFL